MKVEKQPSPAETTQETEKIDELNKIGEGKDTIVMFEEESTRTFKDSSEKEDIDI